MTKSATKEGTTRYAQKFAGRAATAIFERAHRLVLSSVGLAHTSGSRTQRLTRDIQRRRFRRGGKRHQRFRLLPSITDFSTASEASAPRSRSLQQEFRARGDRSFAPGRISDA